MEISAIVTQDEALIVLQGRLDAATSPLLAEQVKSVLSNGQVSLILDMQQISYISSAGLRIVLMTAKQVKAIKGHFAVFGLSASVREVFDISGFSKIIQVEADHAAAKQPR